MSQFDDNSDNSDNNDNQDADTPSAYGASSYNPATQPSDEPVVDAPTAADEAPVEEVASEPTDNVGENSQPIDFMNEAPAPVGPPEQDPNAVEDESALEEETAPEEAPSTDDQQQ